MYSLWIACLLLVLTKKSLQVTYNCLPDNMIEVYGLDTSTVTHVYAVNAAETVCTTTYNGGNATISGCPKDSYILFAYGSYDMSVHGIQGGQSITVDNVTCSEIAETDHIVAEAFTANIQFRTEQAVTVSYAVDSSLTDYDVFVGEDVTMTITFPQEYLLEVTSCTANPGSTFNQASSMNLISMYCTQESELISNFANNGDGTATALIQAFKFYNNNYVYIRCSVKVCPAGGSCDTSCGVRRKREAESDDQKGVFETKIGKVLHVTELSSSASRDGAGLVGLIMVIAAILL